MLVRGLYEVAIPVKHLPRAEAFYQQVLGLEVGLRDERRKWVFLRAGGNAGMIVLEEFIIRDREESRKSDNGMAGGYVPGGQAVSRAKRLS
jgi:catechol 2,3-dioxygenase-like lactoylglutathione lyase family enzyme